MTPDQANQIIALLTSIRTLLQCIDGVVVVIAGFLIGSFFARK